MMALAVSSQAVRRKTSIKPADRPRPEENLQELLKIRLICTDPDATDSSSDEDERISPKRLIRELYIPVHTSTCSSSHSPFFVSSGLDETGSFSYGSMQALAMARPWPRKKTEGLKLKKRKNGKNMKSKVNNTQSSGFKQKNGVRKSSQYTGVRQRRRGKWSAEIRDPSRGVRLWLGTYDSPTAAAKAYEAASKRIRCSLRNRDSCDFPAEKISDNDETLQFKNKNCSDLFPEKKEVGKRSNKKVRCPNIIKGADNNSASSTNSISSVLCTGPSSSPSSGSSMLSDDSISLQNSEINGRELSEVSMELAKSCSGFDYLLKSPSSVLESDLPDESEVAISPVSASLQSSCLSTVAASSYSSQSVSHYNVDVHTSSNSVVGSRAKLDSMAADLNMIMSPSLLDESLCYGEFRPFDIELSRSIGAELVGALEDVMFDDGEYINDLNFDLDMEELAWINVAEGCRV